MLILIIITAITAITACGHPTTDRHEGLGEPGSAQGGQPPAHNAADVDFARHMLPHHQQGVELAAMVPDRSVNPDLRVIAAHIGADQQAELRTLNLLLAQWHETAYTDGEGPAGHEGMPMMGMVDQNTMGQLQSLRGAAFDTLWAKSMIGHHQGAVMMAQDEIAHGESAEAVHLAALIVEAQQREIASMTHLISVPQ